MKSQQSYYQNSGSSYKPQVKAEKYHKAAFGGSKSPKVSLFNEIFAFRADTSHELSGTKSHMTMWAKNPNGVLKILN